MSWLLYGLAAAGTVLIGAAAYYDVFRTVKFQDGVLPANKFFYVPFRGPYKEVNRIFSKVCQDGDDVCKRGNYLTAGLYFDDPSKTPESDCRSWVGILLPPEADPSLGKALAEKGYKEHDVPAAAARVAYFPFKGFLSIIVGVIKVYGAARRTQEPRRPNGECGLACGVLEVYGDQTQFWFPYEHEDAFRHPES